MHPLPPPPPPVKTMEFGTKCSCWHWQDSYISPSLKIFHFATKIKTALSWTSFLAITWTHWYHFLVHNIEIGLPLSSSQKIVDCYYWGNRLVVSHLSTILARADPAGLLWISQGQLRVSTCCDSFRRAKINSRCLWLPTTLFSKGSLLLRSFSKI